MKIYQKVLEGEFEGKPSPEGSTSRTSPYENSNEILAKTAAGIEVQAESGKGIPPAAAASVAGGGDQVSDLDHWMLRVPLLF